MDVIESTSVLQPIQELLLALHIGFSVVKVAMTCASFLESIKFGAIFVIAAPSYLKPVTVPVFCPFMLISLLMALPLFIVSYICQYFLIFIYSNPAKQNDIYSGYNINV